MAENDEVLPMAKASSDGAAVSRSTKTRSSAPCIQDAMGEVKEEGNRRKSDGDALRRVRRRSVKDPADKAPFDLEKFHRDSQQFFGAGSTKSSSIKDLRLVPPSKCDVSERVSFARKSALFSEAGLNIINTGTALNRRISVRITELFSLRQSRTVRRPPRTISEQDEGSEGGLSSSSDSESDEEASDSDEGFQCGHLLYILKNKGPRRLAKPDAGGCKHKLLTQLQKFPETREYVRDAIKREQFMSMVIEDLTEFYKNPEAIASANKGKACEAWKQTKPTAIREQVRDIVKCKRLVSALGTEVHNWLLRYKLLHHHAHEQLETIDERNNRLMEFWDQHKTPTDRKHLPAGHRASTTLPEVMQPVRGVAGQSPGKKRPTLSHQHTPATTAGSRADTPLPGSRASTASNKLKRSQTLTPDGHGPASTWNKSINFDTEQQWNMISLIEESSNQPKTLSKHGMTDHPKYGLKWSSLHKEMRWQMTTPADGTRAALMLQNRTHASRQAMERGFGSEMPELSRSASAPSGQEMPKKLPALAPGKKPGGSFLTSDLPTERYLEACQRCWIQPKPLCFVTGHSARLKGAGRLMMDTDLCAIATMLQDSCSLEEINIGGNKALTEKALVPFFERLFRTKAVEHLEKLILHNVVNAGIRTIETITRLLVDCDGARELKMLDLSHISLTTKCHLQLAKAIHSHDHLNSVKLADTEMGANSLLAKQCIKEILCSHTLHTLDIGWNCFDVNCFLELGSAVVEKPYLTSLSIANCSSASIDPHLPPPITFFLEQLAHDKTLTYLDASLNRMSCRGALILEDALEYHKSLKTLDLSHNSFGTAGIRSILRMMVKDSNVLTFFESEGCFEGSVAGVMTLNLTNPGGVYSLDLKRPYHRSMLRMLYKSTEKFKQQPDQTFLNVKYSLGAWEHGRKNSMNVYEVPQCGTLTFVFNIESAIDNCIKGIADDDYTSFIDMHMRAVKTQPSHKKIIPLFGRWKLLDGHCKDQLVFLNAISKDCIFGPAHLEHLCRSCRSHTCETIYRLFPCILGGEMAEALCMMLIPSVGEFVKMHQSLRVFIDFNIENPTGHYKLNLANPSEYAIAEKLQLLDRWEAVLDNRNRRADTSQRHNRSHFRNEEYQHKSLLMFADSMADWVLAETDELEFDYVSSKRAPKSAAVLSSTAFKNILVSLFDAECVPQSKNEVLRMTAHLLYLTSEQMREFLGGFQEQTQRADAFVTFFLRVTDMWNSKIFRIKIEDADEMWRLQVRLGHTLMFPYMQPENFRLTSHFANYDEQVAANTLLKLAGKEGAINIKEPQFVDANGVVDPLPLGVPRSWEYLEKMPKGGTFECSYNCGPEGRKFKERALLMQNIAAFNIDVEEHEVRWWTGIHEVPKDVTSLLDFLIGNFNHVDEAFKAIDGEDGNGVISLRELEDGLKELQCKTFKGADERERIKTVFRYLDPGGEGSVSQQEWGVLNQLWQEYQMCIADFVHFLLRTFGNDLGRAWEFIDEDCSGELTLDEWLQAVEDIGFFGPSRCVFGLIDKSADGSISYEEFSVLESYKKGTH